MCAFIPNDCAAKVRIYFDNYKFLFRNKNQEAAEDINNVKTKRRRRRIILKRHKKVVPLQPLST